MARGQAHNESLTTFAAEGMPFTISHAGFVFPLKGILPAHVLCGLMIGSIVPDFPYFVREFGVASFAHTVMGAICVSLPVGLAVYLLMSLSFRRIAQALPNPHSVFLASWGIDRLGAKRNLFAVLIAIFLGALSHSFVDSFTHESGAAVSMFPILNQEVMSVDEQPIHVFRLLQYAGSALGMAILVAAYWSGLRRYCRACGSKVWQDPQGWLIVLGLAGVTVLIAVLLNAEFVPRALDFSAFRVFGFKFLITWLPTIGVAFLCFAILRSRSPKSP